jgi:hypothetical protein
MNDGRSFTVFQWMSPAPMVKRCPILISIQQGLLPERGGSWALRVVDQNPPGHETRSGRQLMESTSLRLPPLHVDFG